MVLSFCDLNNDVIQIIIGRIKHYSYLALLKRTCIANYNSVSKLSIARLMLSYKLRQFSPRTFCININCADDTYVHNKQFALKQTTALINEQKYKFNTHYCSECLKKFVLVGDLRNVKHNYDYIDEVNISYTRCKYIFI
jgi:5-methylcytosine-specific restriction endonuclease McrBC GTP-binding regulatory subunit McrB